MGGGAVGNDPMHGLYYHFDNLRFTSSQNIANHCVLETCTGLLVSSEILKCRASGVIVLAGVNRYTAM